MKKIIALALVVVMLFALVSCGISRKADKLEAALEKKYGDDVSVTSTKSELAITALAVAFDIGVDAEDIEVVLTITLKGEGSGYVIYCKDGKTAKTVKADCKDFVEDHDEDDILVKKNGKTVFVGEEDLWKKIKGV